MADSGVAAPAARAGYGAVLRNFPFVRLWLGQAVSNLGDAFYRLALILLITEQTKSPYAISLASMAQLLPMIVFGPFIGVFVDRWEKKRVMVAADLVRAALVAVPLVTRELPVLYAVSFAVGFTGLFFMPARSTVLPEIVGREHFMSAVGLSQITFQIVSLIGPALGGMLVGLWGFGVAFTFDGVSFLVSAAATLSVAIPLVRAEAATGAGTFWLSFREGIRFLWDNPLLRFVVQILTLSVIGFGFFGILIVDYTRNVLAFSSQAFGLMEATIATATILAAFLVGQYGRRAGRLGLIMAALALMSVPGMAFAFRPSPIFVFVWAALMGLGEGSLQLPLSTVFVELTPVQKRGRVFAATNSIANSGSLLGFVGAGPLAAAVGSWNGIALAGAVTVLLLGLMRLSGRYAEVARQEQAVLAEGT